MEVLSFLGLVGPQLEVQLSIDIGNVVVREHLVQLAWVLDGRSLPVGRARRMDVRVHQLQILISLALRGSRSLLH